MAPGWSKHPRRHLYPAIPARRNHGIANAHASEGLDGRPEERQDASRASPPAINSCDCAHALEALAPDLQ